MKISSINFKYIKKTYKWIIFLIFIIILIIIGLFLWARQPLANAKNQAKDIAEQKGKIVKFDKFFMSDLNRTYYTVQGKDKNKNENYVIIDKKTGNINIVPLKGTISQNSAMKTANSKTKINKLISTAPTMFNNKPAWVVSYFDYKNKLCYVTVDLRNGKVIQSISNV
ncbi:PepSY domain-containing protein [Apilactobacillus quenuiae]|uniref:PepSY domain-containing protein n=1 Tax=Apilactobacillus quenuiae TaxID=2008377 RepID=UPI000D019513|nr:PepSY domain-containing protein [Apilactobacillus quenuiae]